MLAVFYKDEEPAKKMEDVRKVPSLMETCKCRCITGA